MKKLTGINIIAALALCAQFAGAEQMESLKDTGVNEISAEIVNVALAAPEAVNTGLPGLFETAGQPSASELVGLWQYAGRYSELPAQDEIRRIIFAVIEDENHPSVSLLSGQIARRGDFSEFTFTFNRTSAIFREQNDFVPSDDNLKLVRTLTYDYQCRLAQNDKMICKVSGEASDTLFGGFFPKHSDPVKVEEYRLFTKISLAK